MKKTGKRLAVLLLVLTMCMGLAVPAMAYADEYDDYYLLYMLMGYDEEDAAGLTALTAISDAMDYVSGYDYNDYYDYYYPDSDYDYYYSSYSYDPYYTPTYRSSAYITLSGASGTYSYGDNFRVYADTNMGSSSIFWNYDHTLLSMSSNGYFTVKYSGNGTVTTEIRAGINGSGVSDYVRVTLGGYINPFFVSIPSSSATLSTGGKLSLSATASNGKSPYSYSWNTDDSRVASVTYNGNNATVTAIGPGTTRIGVTVKDNRGAVERAYCSITVTQDNTPKITSANLSANSISMLRNSSANLYLNVSDNRAIYTVDWTTSNPEVLTVGNAGAYGAVLYSTGNAGTATVTVSVRDTASGQTFSNSCAVTVGDGAASTQYPAPVPVSNVGAALASSNVTVNGQMRSAEIYTIGGTRYCKLRDLAALLNGTSAQFNVEYNASSNLLTLRPRTPYTANGRELRTGIDNSAKAISSSLALEINGQRMNPALYNIGGAIFVNPSDIASYLGFSASYDTNASTLVINAY